MHFIKTSALLSKCKGSFLSAFSLLVLSASLASAQTTAFTYQGKLADNGNPANGQYDFQFKLFDTSVVGTGTQFGPTVTLGSVTVTNGGFTVQLDFGASAFPGADRFLEIGVKTTSASTFTVLGPRQPMTVNPYAIRSLTSTTADGLSVACVNCVTSSHIQSVNGSAVTGTIPVASVPAGSASYIRNTTTQQAASFNLLGNGTLAGTLTVVGPLTGDIVTATTQFNLGGGRILHTQGGSFNLFVGYNAGQGATGFSNAFFGFNAGSGPNNSGQSNSFFGRDAGLNNTSGSFNSYFGSNTGEGNQTGSNNSYFGYFAGRSSTASNNSFFGANAGDANTTGTANAYFGTQAGKANQTSGNNSFFGYHAGLSNIAFDNSFFGANAGSNTIRPGNSFFGSDAGFLNTIGNVNAFFGYTAGVSNTSGAANSFFGATAGLSNTTGDSNSFFGYRAGFSNTTGSSNTIIGDNADVGAGNLSFATAIGAGAVVNASNTVVLGRTGDNVIVPGNLFVQSLGTGGSTNICTDAAGKISTCSSSLRYKTNMQTFIGGLDIVRRLRPITFTWKDSGLRDVGFGAEEVEKIEPLLTTRNAKGEIEGVKYGQLTTVLVNAVKEQQAQIEAQRQQLRDRERQAAWQQQQLQQQQQEIAVLKQWFCRTHPKAALCQSAKPTKR